MSTYAAILVPPLVNVFHLPIFNILYDLLLLFISGDVLQWFTMAYGSPIGLGDLGGPWAQH